MNERDRLIHAYFRVDLGTVRSMIEQDVPALKAHARRIFEGLHGPGCQG